MKIKLQDYSLISNKQIEFMLECLGWDKDTIKQQLIPSEKLAKVCFEQGQYCAKENLELIFDNPIGRFLHSKIEIDE